MDTVAKNVTVKETVETEASEAETAKETIKSKAVQTINSSGKTPALSLAAMRKKAAIQKIKDAEKPEELPTDSFTEEQFQKVWDDYIAILEQKNKRIVHAILAENKPMLKDAEIHLTFSNETMKNDLSFERLDLMDYLRSNLNNYNIELVLHVNEEAEVKSIYTAAQRFEHLATKNSNLLKLRELFKLDF